MQKSDLDLKDKVANIGQIGGVDLPWQVVLLYTIISSMTRLNISNINRLYEHIRPNMVITSAFLSDLGISEKLAWWYVKSGWLEHLAPKAYIKPGSIVSWQGAVVALQQQLQLPVHVGGKSALQLLGRSHYVSQQSPTELFSSEKCRIPTWLSKVDVDVAVFQPKLFIKSLADSTLTSFELDSFNLLSSGPERAMVEILSLLPSMVSFDECYKIMSNLSNLRYNIVQLLLENCCSIKVKRCFLYLADNCQHTWFKDLDVSKIDLGKGKRVISGGGKYDNTYQLSIPDIEELKHDDIP